MSKTKTLGGLALLIALAMMVTSPAVAGDKTTNTILGAGIGAAAGAVLSNGDTLTTLGGAAAGGLLGNLLTEEPRKRRPAATPHWRSHRPHPHYVSHRHKPRYYHHASYKGKGKGKHARKYRRHR